LETVPHNASTSNAYVLLPQCFLEFSFFYMYFNERYTEDLLSLF
jgi:hypothetical protein